MISATAVGERWANEEILELSTSSIQAVTSSGLVAMEHVFTDMYGCGRLYIVPMTYVWVMSAGHLYIVHRSYAWVMWVWPYVWVMSAGHLYIAAQLVGNDKSEQVRTACGNDMLEQACFPHACNSI